MQDKGIQIEQLKLGIHNSVKGENDQMILCVIKALGICSNWEICRALGGSMNSKDVACHLRRLHDRSKIKKSNVHGKHHCTLWIPI